MELVSQSASSLAVLHDGISSDEVSQQQTVFSVARPSAAHFARRSFCHTSHRSQSPASNPRLTSTRSVLRFSEGVPTTTPVRTPWCAWTVRDVVRKSLIRFTRIVRSSTCSKCRKAGWLRASIFPAGQGFRGLRISDQGPSTPCDGDPAQPPPKCQHGRAARAAVCGSRLDQ